MQRFTLTDLALLVTLAALWGGSFMFIKIGVATVAPLTIVAGRLLLGAIVLYLVLRARGHGLPRRLDAWAPFVVIAVIGNIMPYGLIAWGEQRVDSALAAILMAAMPLFTVILARLSRPAQNRITPLRLFGIAVGFAGVVLLIGPAALGNLGAQIIAQVAVLGGALCYALTGVFAERIRAVPPLVAAASTLITAAALSLPLALVLERPWQSAPSLEGVAAVAMLGLLSTALATIIYFHLIGRGGAVLVSLNNYLVPGFGVIWGTLLLGETLSPTAATAMALILVAVAVVNRSTHRAAAPQKTRS